ncbi:MAG: TolC family protein [Gemmatimonadetes bacterium]|nr:TolC family protein [Gemmatimonadota bacterium]
MIRRPVASPLLLAALAAAAARPAFAQARTDTVRLTLASAVATALDRAVAVQLADIDRRSGGVAVLEAYSRFLPSLTAGAGLGAQSGSMLLSSTATVATDARFSVAAWQLSASLNLFNGWRDQASVRAALSGRDAADLSYARARQLVAFDVTQAFEQVVLDRELVGVAEAALGISRAREDQLTEQVRVGNRAPPDLLRQRAQTGADRVRLIAARNRERADRVALLVRLRMAPATPVRLDAPLTLADSGPPPGREEVLAARALAARPDVAAADARVSSADQLVQVARGGWLPRVDLGLDLLGAGRYFDATKQNGADVVTTPQRALADQFGSQRVTALTLGASWALWDRGRTRADVQRARLGAERERIRADDIRLAVLGEVDRALADNEAAREAVQAARAGLDAAEEAFTAVQGRYDVGLASFIELTTAQGALVDARAQAAVAQVNLVLQASVLRLVTGDPLPGEARAR